MPYYVCYAGACDNLSFHAKGRHFTHTDRRGKTWQCVDMGEAVPPREELSKELSEAHLRLGHRGKEASEMVCHYCPDEAALSAYLDTFHKSGDVMLTFDPIPVPLRTIEGGAVRVASTRIPLELVVEQFRAGRDPESIVSSYPTLDLPDVYAVLAYYLRNREAVDAYVARQDEEADALRREVEARQGPGPTRAELLERRANLERERAAPAV